MRHRDPHSAGVRASVPRRGFSLIELLLTLTVMSILIGLGVPALRNFIHREKLLGAAREISVSLRNARLEAIKTNGATAVAVDVNPAVRTITSFVDDDDDGTFDAGERLISRRTLTGGVYFSSPAGNGINDVVDGFQKAGTVGIARFNADGSVDAIGAFRYADARGNFLEIRIDPVSVARVKIRKWDGTTWYARDESPGPWKWL